MSISMKRYNDTIITPKDDRILFDQIFDDYGLIYGGSATMAASNKIHVGAARGFIKGTEVIIEAEDIAVNLSDSGTKNGRLKIVMDLADTETPIKFESEVAASFPALEQDANINYDNGRYEVVFATYKTTETTISSVTLVMPTMQSVKAKIQGINQSLTNIPIFRCGRIRVSYDSPQYLKANVVFDKEMPSYDYSVTIGIDSNVIDCTAIYYENRSVHGFGISIYKADAKFTSVDGVNLSWIAAM